MTPQFTTPCYVRVDDPEKRKEVCDKIEPLGYRIKVDYTDDINPIVVASPKSAILYDASRFEGVPDFIDCGTNIPLFLALAGMRSDTDFNQWFRIEGGAMHKCSCGNWCDDKHISALWRKATTTEIIEHFKNTKQ